MALSPALARLCGPGYELAVVAHAQWLKSRDALFIHTAAHGSLMAALPGLSTEPVDIPALKEGGTPLCVAREGDACVVQKEKELRLVNLLKPDMGAVLTTVPAHARELQAAWTKEGLRAACFVDTFAEELANAPLVLPPPDRPLTLMWYSPSTGWKVQCTVPRVAERLAISGDGTRCAWANMLNHIPEEGERGEFWLSDLGDHDGKPMQVTRNAGRVDEAKLNADGSVLVFAASFELKRPITTHLRLWRVAVPRGVQDSDAAAWETTALTEPGHAIYNFGFCPGEGADKVWYTEVEGCTEASYISSAADGVQRLEHPICGKPAHGTHEGSWAYPTETRTSFATVKVVKPDGIAQGAEALLPHPSDFDSHRVRKVTWKAEDGTDIVGLVCERDDTPADAALLVHAHGGPAVAFNDRRSIAANNTRYPYRHLLAAGYRVFLPLFRGTLGFGDAFAQANIKSQGSLSSDLGDILAGVRHLKHGEGLAFGDRVGIWGGSFGGYMTMRALAVTDVFQAGVALYGFVHGRWMTLEGGDFTWELEYDGPITWPLEKERQEGYVFDRLGSIDKPMLLLHGADDDICPASQSFVAYNELTRRKIPTGCVVYPGEGHGFDQPKHQRDRDERTLQWFLKYLPPK